MQDQLDDAFINDIRNQQFPRQQDFNEPPPKKESHPENQIGEEYIFEFIKTISPY